MTHALNIPLYLNMEMLKHSTASQSLLTENHPLYPWTDAQKKQRDTLLSQYKHLTDQEKHSALHQHGAKAIQRLSQGLHRVQQSNYQREITAPPIVWQDGNSSLLDYGSETSDAPVFLCIPSLINRAYIFDLSEKNSMIRFMRSQGFHPFLLDWGAPGEAEHAFDLEDYITQRLLPALDYLYQQHPNIHIAGYCMGGLIAMACAQHKAEQIQSLTLLATPWDFSHANMPIAHADAFIEAFTHTTEHYPSIPGELIYQLFYFLDPWSVHSKYKRAASMGEESDEYQQFIEREYWLHDYIPLAANVARECFIDWAVHNVTGKGEWTIDGKAILPDAIHIPTYIAMPEQDRIVPPSSTKPLARTIPNNTISYIPTGHIGMVAGRNAMNNLWLPLANWLHNL